MSVLERIAHFQKRRDEAPNRDLARDLAAQRDRAGIREIARNLWNRERAIQADCIKVLYEVGYLEPQLIAPYALDFVRLLRSRNNRLVWGAMIALAQVARAKPESVYGHAGEIRRAMQGGSVITVDNAVSALAWTGAARPEYNRALLPGLLEHLAGCRPKDVPPHAERTLPMVTAANRAEFIRTLEKRMEDLSGPGLVRVKKVIRQAEKTGA